MNPSPRLIILAMAAVLMLPACNQAQKKTTDKHVAVISVDEAAQLVQQGAAVVDLRDQADFEAGHIPGAVRVSLPLLGDSQVPGLTPDRPVVVYAGGGIGLSTAGAKKLIKAGYGQVYEFRGGYEAWVGAGKTINTAAPATRPSG